MSGLHRASKIISAVWFLALITAIPYAVCTEVLLQKHPITEQVTHFLSHDFNHVINFLLWLIEINNHANYMFIII